MARSDLHTVESLAASYAEAYGFPFDEARIAAIEDDIRTARVLAVKRYLDQNGDVPLNLYEELRFKSEGVFTDEEETFIQIPPVMEGKSGRLLLRVSIGSGRKRTEVSILQPVESGFIGYRRFTRNDPYTVYSKGKLDLINMEGVDFKVEGVFESIPATDDGKQYVNPFLIDAIDVIISRKYSRPIPVNTELPLAPNERQQSS